jgi:predicted enzyme related to lactoylglutathione lyase
VNAFVITVSVEDIAATEEAVKGAGGRQVLDRMEIPNVGLLSYFSDPEGNIFGALRPSG